MKFKSLLKIGLPILGVSALAITLPLTLTSCSDSKSSKIESVNLTPAETNVQISSENIDKTQSLELENVPDSWEDKNITYKWYVKSTNNQDAKVSLSDETWTHLIDTKQPSLNIQPIFTIGGDLMGREFKAEAYEGETKVGESSGMTFTMPDGFKPANDAPTTLNDIQKLHDDWSSILEKYNDIFKNHLGDIQQNGWNIQRPDSSSVGQNTYAVTEQNLFSEIATTLGAENFDNIESITIQSKPEKQPLENGETTAEIPNEKDAFGNMQVIVNMKEGQKPEGIDYSGMNLWSGDLYLNQPKNASLYSFDDLNNLIITDLVPVFQTLSLTANPNKVPAEGDNVVFEVDATYFNLENIKFDDEMPGHEADTEGEYSVSFRLFNVDKPTPEEIAFVAGQGEITKYQFEAQKVKPGNYRIVGQIKDESGALVSVMGADTVIGTETSNKTNIDLSSVGETIKTTVENKLNDLTSSENISTTQESLATEIATAISQEGSVTSVSIQLDGSKSENQKATVKITFADGYSLTETSGYTVDGQVLTFTNVQTQVPANSTEEGEDGVQESISLISRFFKLFNR